MYAVHLPIQITCERSAHARSSCDSLADAAAAATIGAAFVIAIMILSISEFITLSIFLAALSKSAILNASSSVALVATHVKGHFIRPPPTPAAFLSISEPGMMSVRGRESVLARVSCVSVCDDVKCADVMRKWT